MEEDHPLWDFGDGLEPPEEEFDLARALWPESVTSASSYSAQSAEKLAKIIRRQKETQAILGDLEERYELILKKKSRSQADRWYRKQVIFTTFSLAWAAFKKLVTPKRLREMR